MGWDNIKARHLALAHANAMEREPGDWQDGKTNKQKLEIAIDKASRALDALALIRDALEGKCTCKGHSGIYDTLGGINKTDHNNGAPLAPKFCVVHGDESEWKKM